MQNWPTLHRLLLICFCITCVQVAADDQKDLNDSANLGATEVIRIWIQPESCLPFKWTLGQKSTLGIVFDGEDHVRIAGYMTDIVPVARKNHENRIEVLLRVTPEQKAMILDATKFSELCFITMAYREELLDAELDVVSYLEKNPQYKLAGERHWGVGGAGDALIPPPTNEELLRFRKRTEPRGEPKSR